MIYFYFCILNMYKRNLKDMFLRLIFKKPDLKSFHHLVLDLNCFCFIQNFVLQDELEI